MTVLVTGSSGRLGHALMAAIPDAVGLTRAEWDLDEPEKAAKIVSTSTRLVIHTAAMTDVEACAREPEVAWRRNAVATAALGRACAAQDVPLIYVSTNEVFDGTADGPYSAHGTATRAFVPPNPYCKSKRGGEVMLLGQPLLALAIVRTAWLFGGGNDFPAKILAVAAKSEPKMPIAVTEAEVGSPTYAGDLAIALAGMAQAFRPGTYHVVNGGHATRVEYARAVLAMAGVTREIMPVQAWPRLSTPPRNAVLASDVPLRSWQLALAEYLA